MTQRAPHGLQQLLWPARSPELTLIEHVWGLMKWELTLSTESATAIAELRQRVQHASENLLQDDI